MPPPEPRSRTVSPSASDASAVGLPHPKAMHRANLIETNWQEGPLDGLAAMVGAWWCEEQAREQRIKLIDIPLMEQIRSYNEVDCRVMMEIISHLRQHH